MVQVIHAERSRMFIPTPPDEFIERFRAVLEDNLTAVKGELKNFKVGIDTSYTWHIKDYDNLILKAKECLILQMKQFSFRYGRRKLKF